MSHAVCLERLPSSQNYDLTRVFGRVRSSDGTCSILVPWSAIVWSISASIASLRPVHGSLHFPTLLRPTSRHPCSAWSQDTNCTLCGHVMDKWGDHALACGCGGDRVTRDNLIRDVVAAPPMTGPIWALFWESLAS